jgi:hypothetical protein
VSKYANSANPGQMGRLKSTRMRKPPQTKQSF